jgi:hypothetical protein
MNFYNVHVPASKVHLIQLFEKSLKNPLKRKIYVFK